MKRTILIANTSDMAGGRPRGVHLHRHHDRGVLPRHGYSVSLMALLDVALAEALREMSGRA